MIVAALVLAAAVAAGADDDRIAGALAAAPPELRDSAAVLAYDDDGRLVELRQGAGELVCLADDPADERFHVACYHRDLEPFMARGRELKAEGLERDALVARRGEEIAAGELAMPDGPRALYSLTGEAGVFDPATGAAPGANRVFVLYVPYATEASTGLPAAPMSDGAPWLMAAGEPWAHVMVVQRATAEDAESGDTPAGEAE